MLINLNDIGTASEFDVCIVGAGPAGITCARRLSAAGKNVILLEGGDLGFSGESQDLYIGETIGDPYFQLDATRLRYFGGSSNHWGGVVPNSGRNRFHEQIGS